jgi:hypothetical protein
MRSTSCLLVLLASVAFCADPVVPKFPDWPIAPVVVPDAPSLPVTKLTGENLYVVQSDAEVQLLASPPGIVTVTEEVGPIRIRGRFVDGTGKTETRTYTKKQVFVIERVQSGNVELLMVPKGAVERRLIADSDPIPPPKPKPPGPNPPDPPAPVTSFRVFLIFESGNTLTAAQNSVLYGKTVEDYLNSKCTGGKAGWRRRDKDLGGENDPTMTALWTAIKPNITVTPCIAVEVNGKVDIIKLGATQAEMVATLNKYFGGK